MTGPVDPFTDRLRAAYAEAFGDAATVDDGYGPVTVDVPADRWVEAVSLARDGLGCTFFDWLSAVDELDDGFRIVCHVAAHRPGGVEHARRTHPGRARGRRRRVPRGACSPGRAGTSARRTRCSASTSPHGGTVLELETLLLPDEFEGHPLRKEFVLASRVAKPWPGAKEPGESEHGGTTSRRRARPPGVPTAEEWGPRDA